MGEKLGMIGLGKMGIALSRQMLKDGHQVAGYDIDPVRMDMLAAEGGTPLASARDVAEGSDITFSILLKTDHIDENTIGPSGITAATSKPAIHVEMSTTHPDYQKALAQKLSAFGIDMLDAPISGSHDKTDARTITFMVGGSDAAFARVQPILSSISADTTHCGPSGAGSAMKVVTNLFVNSTMALMAEMILVGERAGLSHDVMKACLPKGSVGGSMFTQASQRVFERDFAARGAVEIYAKDLGIAEQFARQHGIELAVVPAAREMFVRAEAAGWGKDDACRVIEVYEGKDRK